MEAEHSNGLQVTIQAKALHTRLLNLVRQHGSVKSAAALIEVSPATFSSWMNFKSSPVRPRGDGNGMRWQSNRVETLVIPKLCKLCNCHVSDLFPDWINTVTGIKNQIEVTQVVSELSLSDLRDEPLSLLGAPESAMIRSDIRNKIDLVLKTLTSRERRILSMRFGLDGDGPQTLANCGQAMGCATERVRQIEAKAIRKLRNPVRLNILKDYDPGGAPDQHQSGDPSLCRNGKHKMKGGNILMSSLGHRICRACANESKRRSHAKTKRILDVTVGDQI